MHGTRLRTTCLIASPVLDLRKTRPKAQLNKKKDQILEIIPRESRLRLVVRVVKGFHPCNGKNRKSPKDFRRVKLASYLN